MGQTWEREHSDSVPNELVREGRDKHIHLVHIAQVQVQGLDEIRVSVIVVDSKADFVARAVQLKPSVLLIEPAGLSAIRLKAKSDIKISKKQTSYHSSKKRNPFALARASEVGKYAGPDRETVAPMTYKIDKQIMADDRRTSVLEFQMLAALISHKTMRTQAASNMALMMLLL